MRKKQIKLVGLFLITGLLGNQALAQKAEELRLIELVTLNKGFSLEQHLSYGEEIEHILNRYGMSNEQNFRVVQKASGTIADEVAKVGIFKLSSPQAMQGIFSDKEYLEQKVPKRDKIHNMARMTFLMAKPVMEKNFDSSKTVVMDFVVMNEGYDTKERDSYFKKLVSKYGKRHGLKRFASYEVIQFMRGVGPKGVSLVNFYTIEKETLQNLTTDPEYVKKMVPWRDRIFDMNELSVLVTQSTSK